MKQYTILRTDRDKQEFCLSFSKSKINPQKPIIVNIDYFYKKNSNKQLRAYWRLIKVCKVFMNDNGNNFTDEEVSIYFKLKSSHYTEVDAVKIPRSIALESGTTTQEMKQLIDTILEFGLEFNIDGCEICNDELESLLEYYEKNNKELRNGNNY